MANQDEHQTLEQSIYERVIIQYPISGISEWQLKCSDIYLPYLNVGAESLPQLAFQTVQRIGWKLYLPTHHSFPEQSVLPYP